MSAKKGKAKVEKPVAQGATTPTATEEKKAKRVRGRARAEVAGKVIDGPSSGKPPTLSPGVKLTRTYKGKKVVVTCMEGNRFEYAGKFFKSLSALANEITGSHVSGVAWFGLKPRGGKPARPKGKK